MLDSSYQGVKRLFILAYDNTGNNPFTANSHRKYFLPRIRIKNYNIEIDGRNFYDQPINDQSGNTMKLEKHQQEKVMIIRLDAY